MQNGVRGLSSGSIRLDSEGRVQQIRRGSLRIIQTKYLQPCLVIRSAMPEAKYNARTHVCDAVSSAALSDTEAAAAARRSSLRTSRRPFESYAQGLRI